MTTMNDVYDFVRSKGVELRDQLEYAQARHASLNTCGTLIDVQSLEGRFDLILEFAEFLSIDF